MSNWQPQEPFATFCSLRTDLALLLARRDAWLRIPENTRIELIALARRAAIVSEDEWREQHKVTYGRLRSFGGAPCEYGRPEERREFYDRYLARVSGASRPFLEQVREVVLSGAKQEPHPHPFKRGGNVPKTPILFVNNRELVEGNGGKIFTGKRSTDIHCGSIIFASTGKYILDVECPAVYIHDGKDFPSCLQTPSPSEQLK